MNARRLLGISIVLAVTALAAVTQQPSQVLSAEAMVDPNPPSVFRSTTSSEPPGLGARIATTSSTSTTLTPPKPTVVPEPEPSTTTTTAPPATSAETTATTAPSSQTTTTTSISTTTTAPAGGFNSGHEASFASSINSFRSANGMSSLSADSALNAEARAWAKRLGENGSLSHSNIGRLIPPWSAAAENVGMGPSVSSVFGALKSSSGHRSNMLGEYTHFGVGVWVDSNGALWTAHLFAR